MSDEKKDYTLYIAGAIVLLLIFLLYSGYFGSTKAKESDNWDVETELRRLEQKQYTV